MPKLKNYGGYSFLARSKLPKNTAYIRNYLSAGRQRLSSFKILMGENPYK